jgi:hypothetical protein
MTELARRRRALMMQKFNEIPDSNPQLLISVYDAVISGTDGNIIEKPGCAVTEYYVVGAGQSIRYLNPSTPNAVNGYLGKVIIYDSNKSRIDYWNCRANGVEGSFTVRASGRYFCLNVDLSNEKGSYCYNGATGQIYYAGKDTPYYGKTNISEVTP